MCMEDIRLGRETYSRSSIKAIDTAGVTPIVQPNEWRIHLVVYPGGDVLTIMPGDVIAGGGGGYSMQQGGHPFELDIQKHGDAVRMGWNGQSGAALTNYLVIETFLKKE